VDQAKGGQGNFIDHALCHPAGMPFMMVATRPLEFIVTPDTTYSWSAAPTIIAACSPMGGAGRNRSSRAFRAIRSASGSTWMVTGASTCSKPKRAAHSRTPRL